MKRAFSWASFTLFVLLAVTVGPAPWVGNVAAARTCSSSPTRNRTRTPGTNL